MVEKINESSNNKNKTVINNFEYFLWKLYEEVIKKNQIILENQLSSRTWIMKILYLSCVNKLKLFNAFTIDEFDVVAMTNGPVFKTLHKYLKYKKTALYIIQNYSQESQVNKTNKELIDQAISDWCVISEFKELIQSGLNKIIDTTHMLYLWAEAKRTGYLEPPLEIGNIKKLNYEKKKFYELLRTPQEYVVPNWIIS